MNRLKQDAQNHNEMVYTKIDGSVFVASRHDGDDYLLVKIGKACMKIPITHLLDTPNQANKKNKLFSESKLFALKYEQQTRNSSGVASIKLNCKDSFMRNVDDQIEKKYTCNSFKVGELASLMALSERQLRRKIKDFVDISPAEYIRNFRLEKAMILLKQGKTSNFVSYEVGFSSQSHFGKCFSELVGCSPTKYKSIK